MPSIFGAGLLLAGSPALAGGGGGGGGTTAVAVPAPFLIVLGSQLALAAWWLIRKRR